MDPRLDRLPTETLLSIGSYFRLASDLAAFARVNRRFHDVFNEKLYDPQQQLRLDRRALPSAVKAGCAAGVSKAIQAGWPVNEGFDELRPRISKTFEEATVLYHAVYHGHRSIVKLLVDAGATQSEVIGYSLGRTSPPVSYKAELRGAEEGKRGYGPSYFYSIDSVLELAVQRGELEIAEDLLQRGNSFVTAESIVPAIWAAASQGHDAIFFQLLERLQNEDDRKNAKHENADKQIPRQLVNWLENNAIVDICDGQGPKKTQAVVVSMMRRILEIAKHHDCNVLQPGSLHAVCGSSFDSVELVHLLICCGSGPAESISVEDVDGLRIDVLPINCAVKAGNTQITHYLMDNEFYHDGPSRSSHLLRDLYFGGSDENVDIAQRLFARNVNLPVDTYIVDVIGHLSQRGHGQLFRLLFDKYPYLRDEVKEWHRGRGRHPLFDCCEGNSSGHLVIAQMLLSYGVNPNRPSEIGYETPLENACRYSSHEMISLLLKHGADPTEPWGRPSALDISWRREDFKAIRIILKHLNIPIPPRGLDSDDKAPDRYFAALELKKYGIDFSLEACFLIAVAKGDLEAMDYLYGKGDYPSWRDVFGNGHYLRLPYVSKYQSEEWHPLWLAVSRGHVLAAKKCLDMGYDPKTLASWIEANKYPSTRITPVSMAANDNDFEMLRILLEHDCVSPKDVENALHSYQTGNVQVVKMLYTRLQALRPQPGRLDELFRSARFRGDVRMMNAFETIGAKCKGGFWWTHGPKYPRI